MKKTLANSFTARMGMAGAIASAMLFGMPAHAQDSRLSLADRVSRLEQQAQNQNGTALVNQVQALQSQVQQMQGQIEELQHQLQEANDKNKAQASDFDSRLGHLESGAGAAAANPGNAANPNNPPPSANAAPTPPAAAPTPAPAAAGKPAAGKAAATNNSTAQSAYDDAFKSLRAGDYVKSSRDFRNFIQQYPDSPLLPNAFYWLGESYYATSNYQVAMEAFQHLVSQFPQSEKVPDAMLKVGYSQLEMKQIDAGKATLKNVSAKYPGSKAAGLAQERLRRLQGQSAN
ncbi:tol-pal system protein YbgF [Dyella japonica]|uniref:Cell division coordinator CpoB n=1 Tax=Dyella japonica A8 TaxID=1217721 RepID=A0A075JZR2_9GAMM|nr:tol-pal system protein YbgF [Dyella japonica]AIF47055.1 tol-pal system protein [Dyella japonica A8]